VKIGSVSENIVESVISYESGISWKSVNKRMTAIDYGLDTDHVSAKISVWGSVEEITEFRNKMPKVSCELKATFDKGEKPFGPAFNCEGESTYLLINIDDMTTTDKGTAQLSFQLAALWTSDPPWAYAAIKFVSAAESEPPKFDLSKFAVQEIKRDSEEDKHVSQMESGWSAFRHDWSKPKLTLSLLANSQTIGETIRWLAGIRVTPFLFSNNNSMIFVNFQQEEHKKEEYPKFLCISFGNLRRLGASNFWQADFDFVRYA
jgi:hypothetical protein